MTTNPRRAADVPPARFDTPPALASHRAHRRGSTLTTTFRELGILPETAEALEAVGIITPFPIQEMTLPVALSGTDVIGQAKTGTGKTLGFGLPLLERVTVLADVEAGRAAPGNLRFDDVVQANRKNHFTVIEAWKSQADKNAWVSGKTARTFREELQPIGGALYDERDFKVLQ